MKKKRYPTILIPFMIPLAIIMAVVYFLFSLLKLFYVLAESLVSHIKVAKPRASQKLIVHKSRLRGKRRA